MLIETERLLLRPAVVADRAAVIEMLTDPQVRAHLGGPKPVADAEADFDRELGAVTLAPGTGREYSLAVSDRGSDHRLGTVSLAPRPAGRPGHVRPGGEEWELSYVLRRSVWARGYGEEAAQALLTHVARREPPEQPVVAVTQSANVPSLRLAARMGFIEVETFAEFGVMQRLLVARLAAFRSIEAPRVG